jgi:hypothetical protein
MADIKIALIPLSVLIVLLAAPAPAAAPESKALPAACKLAAETDQYRMVECTYKPGEPVEFSSPDSEVLLYFETECSLRTRFSDSSTRDFNGFAGYAGVRSAVGPRTVENFGKSQCKVLMFGPK